MLRAAAATVLLLGLCAGCGPAGVRPVSYPDPEVLCPGGRLTWRLQILDQRAQRQDEPRVVAAVRDGIQKSFPGCRWGESTDAGTPTITVEIHRFAARFDGSFWDAAVEWTVSASAGAGTLSAFEANEEVSRPNYQGSNNEQESLTEAFRRALQRTAKGLAAISAAEAIRPRQGTPARDAGGGAAAHRDPKTLTTQQFAGKRSHWTPALEVEQISQLERSEDL